MQGQLLNNKTIVTAQQRSKTKRITESYKIWPVIAGANIHFSNKYYSNIEIIVFAQNHTTDVPGGTLLELGEHDESDSTWRVIEFCSLSALLNSSQNDCWTRLLAFNEEFSFCLLVTGILVSLLSWSFRLIFFCFGFSEASASLSFRYRGAKSAKRHSRSWLNAFSAAVTAMCHASVWCFEASL
jgi:hypothetical protein